MTTIKEEYDLCSRILFYRRTHNSALPKIESSTQSKSTPHKINSIHGRNLIDDKTIDQYKRATVLPVVQHSTLLPDAHHGYGVPIGTVLACENAIIPAAVGVDIGCRMHLTVLNLSTNSLDKSTKNGVHTKALEECTAFGIGASFSNKALNDHPVLYDPEWDNYDITKALKDKARAHLGTSGSGNHFVEWGIFTPNEEARHFFGLDDNPAPYLALLSHSGSRGPGAKVADYYMKLAKDNLPSNFNQYEYLPWLPMDHDSGKEYWNIMNLIGDYAAANHEVIHKNVLSHVGYTSDQIVLSLQNHHNFAWHEDLGGKKYYVHRKGATPSHLNEVGIIPGSMCTPTYIVKGKGYLTTLNSSSHGAGRCLSRKQAKDKFTSSDLSDLMLKTNTVLLGAGVDEIPYAYKDIKSVMAEQASYLDVLGTFIPKIVKMDK